jgi:MtN3 and saliva related transmembrane protein
MDWTSLVGTIGATASVASFAPQAWKIIRSRSTEGLSFGMFALTTLAFLAWMTFGLLKGEWALIVPNSICLMFATFILVMIALPNRRTADVARAIDPTPTEEG